MRSTENVSSGPVVCGIDGSSEAATAAQVAARIAARLDRPLALVHVAPQPSVPERPYATRDERLQERVQFEHAGYLHTVLERVEVAEAPLVARIVEWGNADDVLRSVARGLAAELLVVGSRGQSAVEDVLIPGSTSMALARAAPVPVVITPPATGEQGVAVPGDAVACGVDGSPLSIAAARTAGRLAERLGVPLVLVTVDSGDAGDDAAEASVADVAPGVDVRAERARGPVAEGLIAASARHDAGLIAVGSRGRGALTSAVLGSVTATLLRRSDRPVLVVPRGATDPDSPE